MRTPLILAATLILVGCDSETLTKVTDALNAVASAAPAANLIVNGGFEEPVVPKGSYATFQTGQSFPGWQVTGAPGSVSPISGDYARSGLRWNAQSGAQWIDMTGPSASSGTGIQQTVRTQPGATYTLVFYVGNVVAGGFGTNSSMEVLVDGKSLGTARNDSNIQGQQSWQRFQMSVTATTAATTIAFINRDPRSDNSNGLDSVSLTASAAAVAMVPVLSDSFETPVTGNYVTYKTGQSFSTAAGTWTVSAGSIDVVNAQVRREVVAYDGNQSVDLAGSPGAGVMATSFATTAGQSYALTFHYARNNGLGATPGRARVEVAGTRTLLTAEIRHDSSVPFNAQQLYTGKFVADGPRTTLRFTSLNNGNTGITVDGISISAATP